MNATEICWRKRAIHPAAAAVARGQGPRRLWNEEPRQGGRHLRPLTYPARVGQAILCRFAETANAPSILLDLGGQTGRVAERPVSITLTEAPALKTCPKALRDKVTWDREQNTLTIAAPLSADETETLKAAVKAPASVAAIDRAAEESRTSALEFFETPAERGERFRVPQLALHVQGELRLFDDPEVLDYPWDLSTYDAAPTPDDIKALAAGFRVAEGGEIDVDAAGHITPRFLPSLERDLGLAYRPEEWDARRLATWLCRNLPEASLTHGAKRAFVASWLADLLQRQGFSLARANLQKFQIRNLIEARVRALRKAAVAHAYQRTLFGDEAAGRVAVGDLSNACLGFEFHPHAYAPARDYDWRFGRFDFRCHYYGRIGDFDSREEFECACWLDTQAQRGRIRFWVRNLVRREGASFFLQKADGRFYPDFICQLPGGPVLAVEYKGAQGWTDAADDRLIGGLWADLSDGRCRFVMVRDRDWGSIDAVLD